MNQRKFLIDTIHQICRNIWAYRREILDNYVQCAVSLVGFQLYIENVFAVIRFASWILFSISTGIWYIKNIPNRLYIILNIKRKTLNKLVQTSFMLLLTVPDTIKLRVFLKLTISIRTTQNKNSTNELSKFLNNVLE